MRTRQSLPAPASAPPTHSGLRALHEGDSTPFAQSTNYSTNGVGPSAGTIDSSGVDSTASANNNAGDVAMSVAEELQALSLQVSRLEANMDKMLAVLGEEKKDVAGAGEVPTTAVGTGDSREANEAESVGVGTHVDGA